MANKPNNLTSFRASNIQGRMRKIQQEYGIPDTTRQKLQNQFEAACLFWFLQGGGSELEFDNLFNEKKQ